MIRLLTTTNLTRSQMIEFLGISRATFYRWLSDLRVRRILKDFEKANLERITAEFEKRWQERIKITRQSGPKRELVYSPPHETEERARNFQRRPKKRFGKTPPSLEEIVYGRS